MADPRYSERLFSYGTLQLTEVQQANFGRRLEGKADAMIGWRKDRVEITDPQVLAESGERFHPIVRKSENSDDQVTGQVFAVSAEELLNADAYEVDDYHRIQVILLSGDSAWVYVAKTPVWSPQY